MLYPVLVLLSVSAIDNIYYFFFPGRRHTLDPVALAALASREDFSRVSLRRTKGPGKEKDEYDGSLPVMLIQIKGKLNVFLGRLTEGQVSHSPDNSLHYIEFLI